jgi:hypothetical protein
MIFVHLEAHCDTHELASDAPFLAVQHNASQMFKIIQKVCATISRRFLS